MTAIGDSEANRRHLQIANRWVIQYNFYINDRQWGRMFVRISTCRSPPASASIKQHHWLANRMREGANREQNPHYSRYNVQWAGPVVTR